MILRAQVGWQYDTAFVVDAIQITPHFKVTQLPTDDPGWTTLTDDLFNAFKTWMGATLGAVQTTIKWYDAETLVHPNYPKFEKTYQSGVFTATTANRETALCLSYYADTNRPRRRGRLYLPGFMVAGGGISSARPSGAVRQKAADVVPLLSGLGGLNVDWVVWSRSDRQAHTVTNWFVDDAWDSQRRRGLKPTTRLAGSTSG